MALLHSVSTSQNSNHASAAGVASSQTNSIHHTALYTSAKIAGVILFVVLCALIVVNAKASGKEANDEFNAANKDSAAALELKTSAVNTSTKAGGDAMNQSDAQAAGGNSISASISNGSVEVSVNGQPVEVPAGSNYSKVVSDPNGTTTIQVSNSGTANNTSFSSSSTFVSSSSSSISSGSGSTFTNNFYTSP